MEIFFQNFFRDFWPRYLENQAKKDAILAVAGKGSASERLNYRCNERIKFLDELDYMSLLSLYKRSSTFIHLAYLDHCPNVVVDAQAAGCNIICSSTGGTSEILEKGTIVVEEEWNFKPCKLYQPPKLKFNSFKHFSMTKNRNIVNCSKKYYDVIKGLL